VKAVLKCVSVGMTGAAAALLLGTGPAVAKPITPLSATGCASNVCIYLAGNAGGTALVQGWARSTSFYGYFTLTGPNGINVRSGTQTWLGQKGNYWSTSVGNAPAGTYCITGNPGQGTACEHLS